MKRSKLQGEIRGTLFFKAFPYLILSGLLPSRWVACSNSFNSESDIYASAISQPWGQFDLQNMSHSCLEASVNQDWVRLPLFFFFLNHQIRHNVSYVTAFSHNQHIFLICVLKLLLLEMTSNPTLFKPIAAHTYSKHCLPPIISVKKLICIPGFARLSDKQNYIYSLDKHLKQQILFHMMCRKQTTQKTLDSFHKRFRALLIIWKPSP